MPLPLVNVDAVLKRNNVRVSGDPSGRPIVFAHGFGCSQEMWRFVAPQFEAEHRVILFDYVGAGGSDLSAYDPGKYDSLNGYAADVLEILEALDLDDVVFVGHSVSSMIGVTAAVQDPSRFGALVLVGPSARYVSTNDYVGAFSQTDIDGLLDSLDANYLGWSSTMAPVIMGNANRPELGQELEDSFCRIDPAVASQFARVTFLSDSRRDLPLVPTPTLVLQCSSDAIAPLEVGAFVADQIPNSTMVVLTATGHLPHLSDPESVVREIRTFLE
jgi:sigma-B regulation protein RsbQ